MAEKKKQHIIPRCYLQAWCDPRTPPKQHPYIWRISKDGASKTKRSPEKSFTATDKYTIRLPNGQRNLVIEDTLSQIEGHFVAVLRKVRKRQTLSATDRARLCVFAAAMHSRTASMGQHWKRQMSRLHEVVADLEKAHSAPPSTSLQTARMVELAHQEIIAQSLEFEPPILFRRSMAILITDDEVGFITSDAPCVWFNPQSYKMPPIYRSPGLAQRHIEVTLPLTPQHMLLISHGKLQGYLNVNQAAVDETNRTTRFACSEEFISWKGETKHYWFDPGKEPEDSWEKSEVGKRALAERERFEKARKDYEG